MPINIILLLDSSGSMSSMGNEPVEAINKFITDQKLQMEEGSDDKVTLYTFSNVINPIFRDVPLADCKEFKDYHPNGCTALYDCIDQAIKNVENKEIPTVMVIVTDGQDNSSKLSANQAKQLMDEMRNKHTWNILFLAKGEDAFEEQQKLGIARGSTTEFGETLECAMSSFVSSAVTKERARVSRK